MSDGVHIGRFMTYIDDRLLGDRPSRKYNISESIVRRRSEAANNRIVSDRIPYIRVITPINLWDKEQKARRLLFN